ncbi:hypothetical protein ACS0TY_017596 [Phlomoides rotata]
MKIILGVNVADMAEAMKNVSKTVWEFGQLTPDERILLSVGYKKVIEPRRAACKKLFSILEEESNMAKINRIIEYGMKAVKEMSDICGEVVSIINVHLIPPSINRGDHNSAAFYFKMKGDYYRYLAEYKTGNDRTVAANQSFKAYRSAMKFARRKLPPTSPIRLGVALNFSVFYYVILGFPDSAYEISKIAFDEAIYEIELDILNEEADKASQIMELLMDNMILFNAEKYRLYNFLGII